MIKINNFWGDLSAISAKTATLHVTWVLPHPVKFLSKLSYYYFGYFDPIHIYF